MNSITEATKFELCFPLLKSLLQQGNNISEFPQQLCLLGYLRDGMFHLSFQRKIFEIIFVDVGKTFIHLSRQVNV